MKRFPSMIKKGRKHIDYFVICDQLHCYELIPVSKYNVLHCFLNKPIMQPADDLRFPGRQETINIAFKRAS